MEVKNIFSLHGKWYDDNENRLTSNILFFLEEFRKDLLTPFIKKFLPKVQFTRKDINNCRIQFQIYDKGRRPDAEIIIGDKTRILIESKISANTIEIDQISKYLTLLENTKSNYPNYYLLVFTQTDQKSKISEFLQKIGKEKENRILYYQWKFVLEIFSETIICTKNCVLKRFLEMFMEEVENTMYNRIDMKKYYPKDLNEVVFTTQKRKFTFMALKNNVFWPNNRFSPSQFVAYYFTKDNAGEFEELGGNLAYMAKIKYMYYDVTIDEVLTSIPEFKKIPNFESFKKNAIEIYKEGDPTPFVIAITETPFKLKYPIPYKNKKGNRFHPNILPGNHTTISKILTAEIIEDLIIDKTN